MKKKIFCVLTKKKELKKKNFYQIINFYKSCIPKGIDIYILDLSKIVKDKTKLKIMQKNKNFNYLEISSYNLLKSFFKDKDAIITGFENIDFESTKVQFFISKFSIKRLFVSDLGYIAAETGNEKYKLKEKISTILNLKLPYYVFRFLCLFGLVKNIEFFFESSQNRINQINASISKKLNKIIGIDLSYYLNIYRINSKGYDQSIKQDLKEINIVYCDSGFDHPDKFKREGKSIEDDREKYYLYLFNLLKQLSIVYNQKVIFIKHPKNPYPLKGNFLKIKKKFQIQNASAEKYLINANIVILHVSTLITRAMQLKKKIILINSRLVGNYLNIRSINWIKNTKLFKITLSEKYKISKNRLNKALENKIRKYESFLKKNSYKDKHLDRSQQIKKVLQNYYNIKS